MNNSMITEQKDRMTGALVGLSRAFFADTTHTVEHGLWQLLINALTASCQDSPEEEETLHDLLERIHAEKVRLAPDCAVCASPCGKTADYDLTLLYTKNILQSDEVRSLKILILTGIRQIAACLVRTPDCAFGNTALHSVILKALFCLGEDWLTEELLPVAIEVGSVCPDALLHDVVLQKAVN